MKKTLFLMILLATATTAFAQLPVPSVEVQVKGGYSFYEGRQIVPGIYDGVGEADMNVLYSAPAVGIEALASIIPYVSVGIFYNRSVTGNYSYKDYDDFGGGGADRSAQHLMYGAKLRASLGRQIRFRPFVHAVYYKKEMVADFDTFSISHKNSGIGAGLGLMVKLNDRLYITAPQLTIFFSEDRPVFIDNTPEGNGSQFGLVEAGVSYYIHNKR